MVCPNCDGPHPDHTPGCFLSMLLKIVNARREEPLTDEQVARVFENVDTQDLWDRFGGPAADYVEEAAFDVGHG